MVRKYPTYKDSGIAWIGEIPEGWDCITLKRVFSNRDGGAWGEEAKNNENDRICIRIADFDYPRMTIKHDINYTVRNYAQDVIKKLTLQKNDILVEKSGGGEQTPVGRTIIFNENFEALYANFMDRLRVRRGNVPKFIEYLLVSFYQNGITYQYIKQTTGIQNLDVEELLAKEYAALPSEREQRAIADYLDKKCAAIDKTIETEEKVIEKLKEYKQSLITETVTKGLDKSAPMKDSGIPWIGQIPQHYDVCRIKNYITLKTGTTPSSSDAELLEGEYNWFTPVDFSDTIILSDSKRKINILAKEKEIVTNLPPYTVFIIGIGATTGKIGFSMKEGSCNQQITAMLTNNNSINSKFLMYWMLANSKFLRETALFTTLPIINNTTLGQYVLIKPILNEQKRIVSYLDNKCFKIDKAIEDKEQVIEKLTEYKKSLIYECVTGKRMVA